MNKKGSSTVHFQAQKYHEIKYFLSLYITGGNLFLSLSQDLSIEIHKTTQFIYISIESFYQKFHVNELYDLYLLYCGNLIILYQHM